MKSIAALLTGTMLIAAPAFAQQTAPAAAPAIGAAPAAGAVEVAAGAKVVDTKGGDVGTIEAINNGIATLNTGTNKVGIPVASFAKGPSALVIALSKAEIDAKAAQASAASAPQFTVGATVSDQTGARVGTVKAVTDTLVTVDSGTASAQLPKTAFAGSPTGLVIGLTPAQFEAAAKSAAGKS